MSEANYYIVRLRFTPPDGGPAEEYAHPVCAYNLAEAGQCALYELDAEHDLLGRKYAVKVLSIRPDTSKTVEEYNRLLDSFKRESHDRRS